MTNDNGRDAEDDKSCVVVFVMKHDLCFLTVFQVCDKNTAVYMQPMFDTDKLTLGPIMGEHAPYNTTCCKELTTCIYSERRKPSLVERSLS